MPVIITLAYYLLPFIYTPNFQHQIAPQTDNDVVRVIMAEVRPCFVLPDVCSSLLLKFALFVISAITRTRQTASTVPARVTHAEFI